MISTPSVMCTFAYPWEQVFFFALLLSVVSVFFVRKIRYGYIIGTVVLAFSIGTYPTYIGFTAGLFVLLCCLDLINKPDVQLKTILTCGMSYILVMLAAIMLYYIILRLVLHFTGMILSNYRGINNSLYRPNFSAFFYVIKDAYKKVVYFFLYDYYGMKNLRFKLIYRCVAFLNIIMLIYIFIKTKINYKYAKLMLFIILLLIFPIAIHLIAILGQNSDTH